MMIIDILECDIVYHMEQNIEKLPYDAYLGIISHLTKNKWMVFTDNRITRSKC